MSPNYDEIIPGRLWVGSYLRPQDVIELKWIGISSIVSLQSDEDLALYGINVGTIIAVCEREKIGYRRVATPDFDKTALSVNLPRCVAEVESALSQSASRVYLHCTAGINRAPTTAAAYLVRTRGFSAADAYRYVKDRRECEPYYEVLESYARNLSV